MRILVTGGAGYIGSHAVKRLLERGDEVTVYDDLSTGRPDHVAGGAELIVDSITRGERLADVLSSRRIEAVIHFAARSTLGDDARRPAAYYETNVQGTTSLLGAMVRAGVGTLVVSSSCSVYGIPPEVPVTEQTPRLPISVYGETKLTMENAVRAWGDRYGICWTALRYFNAAGAADDGTLGENHDPETHLLPLAVRAALGLAPPLTIFGRDHATPDGTPVRDYVHVEDLVAAHLLALERGVSGAYNLGTGLGTSVAEMLEAVARATRRAVPTVEGPRREGDPPRLVADAAAARAALGWAPARTLDRMVESVVAWERRRQA